MDTKVKCKWTKPGLTWVMGDCDGIAYDKVLLGRIYLGVSDALNKIK